MQRRLMLAVSALVAAVVVVEGTQSPYGPSSGSAAPAKPAGFGVPGVNLASPDSSGSKAMPFDLTDCNVADCVICDESNKNLCLMCDPDVANQWRRTDGSACDAACASGNVKVGR